jgi:hypothetical protein
LELKQTLQLQGVEILILSRSADKAQGWGGQISGDYRLRTGGPGSYAKISALKKGKRPLD